MWQKAVRLFALDLNTYSYIRCTTVRNMARKPIWMGTAKSKIFRVPKRPQIPQEETEEIKRLWNNYRTQIKSLRTYFTDKYCVSNLATSDPEQQKIIFEEDFERCSKLNDKWNAEQRLVREKQAAERLAVELESARNIVANYHEEQSKKLEQIEDIVQREIEASKSFITVETLDAAIEHALANPVDYNFAIDLEGNRIHGRETNPEKKQL